MRGSIAELGNPWWWIYRIDFYNPQGWVDIPVYAGGGFTPIRTNAVYFRGAHFLDDLRGAHRRRGLLRLSLRIT